MSDAPLPHSRRSSVILYADVATPRATAVPCRARNLSQTGACVDNSAALAEGDRVRVAMGVPAPLDAEMIWAKPTLAGLRFAREVDLAAGWIGGLDDPYRRRAP